VSGGQAVGVIAKAYSIKSINLENVQKFKAEKKLCRSANIVFSQNNDNHQRRIFCFKVINITV
jgi:hypothetical protein